MRLLHRDRLEPTGLCQYATSNGALVTLYKGVDARYFTQVTIAGEPQDAGVTEANAHVIYEYAAERGRILGAWQ